MDFAIQGHKAQPSKVPPPPTQARTGSAPRNGRRSVAKTVDASPPAGTASTLPDAPGSRSNGVVSVTQRRQTTTTVLTPRSFAATQSLDASSGDSDKRQQKAMAQFMVKTSELAEGSFFSEVGKLKGSGGGDPSSPGMLPHSPHRAPTPQTGPHVVDMGAGLEDALKPAQRGGPKPFQHNQLHRRLNALGGDPTALSSSMKEGQDKKKTQVSRITLGADIQLAKSTSGAKGSGLDETQRPLSRTHSPSTTATAGAMQSNSGSLSGFASLSSSQGVPHVKTTKVGSGPVSNRSFGGGGGGSGGATDSFESPFYDSTMHTLIERRRTNQPSATRTTLPDGLGLAVVGSPADHRTPTLHLPGAHVSTHHATGAELASQAFPNPQPPAQPRRCSFDGSRSVTPPADLVVFAQKMAPVLPPVASPKVAPTGGAITPLERSASPAQLSLGIGTGAMAITGQKYGPATTTTTFGSAGTGAVGAGGRYYSHVVADSGNLSFSLPMEVTGYRATGFASPTTAHAGTVAPNSASTKSNSGNTAAMFSSTTRASIAGSGFDTQRNAVHTSRRRTSVHVAATERYHKLTDPRYAGVVLLPMAYGEGAQTFYGSTALSRQRRSTTIRSHSAPTVIYSAKQLLMQRIIHIGLEMPEQPHSPPRYNRAPGTVAATIEMLVAASPKEGQGASSPASGGGSVSPRSQHAYYGGSHPHSGGATGGGDHGRSAASPSSHHPGGQGTTTPTRRHSVEARSPAALNGNFIYQFTGNYALSSSASPQVVDTVLRILASHPLINAPIQIADTESPTNAANKGDGDHRLSGAAHGDENGSVTDALNNTVTSVGCEAAMAGTMTFCVEDVQGMSGSASASPRVGPDLTNSGSASQLMPSTTTTPALKPNVSPFDDQGMLDRDPLSMSGADGSEVNNDSISTLKATINSAKVTTNLSKADTIENLYRRSKSPLPEATAGQAPQGPAPTLGKVSALSVSQTSAQQSAGATLNINKRRANSNKKGDQDAIQAFFSENKRVAETFKAAAEQAAQAAASNSAVPTVLQRGVVRDVAPKQFLFMKKAQEKRKRVAVIIGIGKYEDRRIVSKDQCVVDAESLAQILTNIGFKVTVMTTASVTESGERDPDLYPTKANVTKAITEATKHSKNEECISIIAAFGGGYIGPVTQVGNAPSAAQDVQRRRTSLAAVQGGASANSTPVFVPPDIYLGQINSANTITIADLETGHPQGPKNIVFIDTYNVLKLKPCDQSVGGFCLAGGRKCVGSDIAAFYTENQFLLMSFYIKRGFMGYATRDSRITVNGLNAYLTRKLNKYGASVQSTASTFFVGDVDLARVHELRYCRHEINEIKVEQYNHFAKFHMSVIPTRNQDPASVEFVRAIQRKFLKSMKSTPNATMVCYSRLYRQKFHFFMRSVIPEKLYLNDAAFVSHESKALLGFKEQLRDQNLTYQLQCFGQSLAGSLHIRNPVTRREFLQKFDNGDTIRKIKRLRKEVEIENREKLQVGRVHHLTQATKVSAASSLNSLLKNGGAGYLADTFTHNFNVDGMAVHEIGIEMLLTFITSEYLAQKMDKIVRVGVLGQDLITSALQIEPLDERSLYVEKIVSKAQAIIRGHQVRKIFSKIIPLVKREQKLRALLVIEQQEGVLRLQRETFASHCGTLEAVETKQRELWDECWFEDRELFFSEYADSFTRAARKDKVRKMRQAEEQDYLMRREFNFRCGFSAFAYSLMSTIRGMIKTQAKHDRQLHVIMQEEDTERRILQTKLRRALAY